MNTDFRVAISQVAARTAAPFNPSCKITPIHANIKDPQYDVQWFSGFKIVLNALDNLGAPIVHNFLRFHGRGGLSSEFG
jgi:ubiquitin-like 1-activating enzyme E1 B